MNKKSFKAGIHLDNPTMQFITPPAASAPVQETAKKEARPQKELKTARVNYVFYPSTKENLEKLAFLDKTSANDLVHSLLVKYIASRKQDIEKYDAFFGEQNT